MVTDVASLIHSTQEALFFLTLPFSLPSSHLISSPIFFFVSSFVFIDPLSLSPIFIISVILTPKPRLFSRKISLLFLWETKENWKNINFAEECV